MDVQPWNAVAKALLGMSVVWSGNRDLAQTYIAYLLLLDFNRFNLFCWFLHGCGVTIVILTSILVWGHHHSSLSAVQDDKKVREGVLL